MVGKVFLAWNGSVQDVHLYKELGEIPYYLSDMFGYDAIVDDYVGHNFKNGYFRTVQLHSYSQTGIYKEIRKILHILIHARTIDILYLVHARPNSYIRALAYRCGGGKGKIYLKMDEGPSPSGVLFPLDWSRPHALLFHKMLMSIVDVFTIESDKAFHQLKQGVYNNVINEKAFLMPNGFDPEILDEIGVTRKTVSDKEKIMITVGRLGTHQKNTELLLDVLSKIDLQDWKVYLVGPIEDSFIDTIHTFYEMFPEKRDSVVFTGMISQDRLYEYYNKSRVFLLTSRYESFGFVLAEAAYMNNYIISTDVGAAEEIVENYGGKLIMSEDPNEFATVLGEIISLSDIELNRLVDGQNISELTWKYILKNNVGIQKIV